MDANSSREDRAAFRAKVQQSEEHWRAKAREVVGADPMEQAIWQRITMTYRDMMWFETTHQFPNGLPLDDQWEVDLELWSSALSGIRGHQYGH